MAAATSLVSLSLIVSSLGPTGYGTLGLITGLPALMPVADLGIGAAIISAVALAPTAQKTLDLVASGIRVLVCTGSLLCLAGIIVGGLDLWPVILGSRYSGTSQAAMLALAIFGLSLPLTVSSRVLTGSDRTHFIVYSQGLASIATLVAVVLTAQIHPTLPLFVASTMMPYALTGLIAWIAAERLAEFPLTVLLRQTFSCRRYNVDLRTHALPMMVISCALPVAYQTDRVILSHLSTLDQVARYSAASQLYLPLLSLVSIGGQTLWPEFSRRRAANQAHGLRQTTLLFGAVGMTAAIGLALVGPNLIPAITGGRLSVGYWLMAAFASLILVQSLWQPSGMFLTSPEGLRYQARLHVLMALLNVGLSIFLTPSMGAIGPVAASSVSVALCLLAPVWWRLAMSSTIGASNDHHGPVAGRGAA